MGRLSKLIENVKRLDYSKLLDECFVETEEELIKILRSQLLDGRSGIGDMPLYQSKYYARKKGTNRVNLRLTGAFHEAFKVYQNKYSVRVRSTDKKNKMLIVRYGAEIFELDSQSYHEYISVRIIPLFKKKMKNGMLK